MKTKFFLEFQLRTHFHADETEYGARCCTFIISGRSFDQIRLQMTSLHSTVCVLCVFFVVVFLFCAVDCMSDSRRKWFLENEIHVYVRAIHMYAYVECVMWCYKSAT